MQAKRLKILSKSEINELYDIPQFTQNEKEKYFSVSKEEHKVMLERGSLASRVYFILQLGYFKATAQFFNCSFDEVKNDVNFILNRYFDKRKLSAASVTQKTRQTNKGLIATLLGYQIDKAIVKSKLKEILETKTKLCSDPVYLCHEVLCFTTQHKMLLPSYSSIQDLIGATITNEEKRLGELFKKYLSHQDWKFITNMFLKDGNEYFLTALKKDPKSFKQKHVKAEIKKLTDNEVGVL